MLDRKIKEAWTNDNWMHTQETCIVLMRMHNSYIVNKTIQNFITLNSTASMNTVAAFLDW